ncbi:nuclease-related domain-containing protein [Pseudalkalibacillus berkeleyi]|uniref:NERD domain-containing protein n=1 Tax=Pseudalkalibacillus berkeleyi TaxID=1069813 RepID=A0ABS9H120_9BACL|nr:nuclease-related domain-containing protein [Pseudalkalibacillus berkeleyi]MCF6138687.1 NERD domain-containing protein [Pseudalkalibacillus berkeleyi]
MERTKPIKMLQNEVLLRRLVMTHPKRPVIEADLSKLKAGFKGEQTSDYYVSLLPQNIYHLLPGLRLKDGDFYFQMDSVIITSKLIFVLEVKNIAGTIYFDLNNDQMIRTLDEVEEGFQNPYTQVQLQKKHLKNWLHHHKFPDIPIETLVVISHPSTILKNTDHKLQNLTYASNLPFEIESTYQKYYNKILTKKDYLKLKNKLKRSNEPLFLDILKTYQINKADILTGVHCPECNSIPMLRIARH